jgi:hypothetical protein
LHWERENDKKKEEDRLWSSSTVLEHILLRSRVKKLPLALGEQKWQKVGGCKTLVKGEVHFLNLKM